MSQDENKCTCNPKLSYQHRCDLSEQDKEMESQRGFIEGQMFLAAVVISAGATGFIIGLVYRVIRSYLD